MFSRLILIPIFLLSGLMYGQQSDHLPLTITISGPAAPVKAGKDVYLSVEMKNVSDIQQDCSSYYVNGTDLRFRVEVKNEDGKSMKRGDLHSEQMPGSFQPCTLLPGESQTVKELIISRFHDLTRPGNYQIQLSRVIARDEKNGLAKSNKITITIAP